MNKKKIGRPSKMPAQDTDGIPWAALADWAGGVEKLANRFNVTPQTLYYWAHGKRRMSGLAKAVLEQVKKEFLDSPAGRATQWI